VPGQKKVRLSGASTTEEYYEAYRSAIGQSDSVDSSSKIKAGSFRALVAKYGRQPRRFDTNLAAPNA
jgi:hypothetical protein